MRTLPLLTSLFIFSVGYSQSNKNFSEKLSNAAIALTFDKVQYDPSYFSISYPNGDVPANKGVCTDVIIRAYRKMGIDLQKEVHEDIKNNFSKYPHTWGLSHPDENIDHRRVPNLAVFFSRFGITKKMSTNPGDFEPGDIITWDLGGGLTHIGMLINKRSADGKRYLIVHNIGRGREISDCLFSFKITGHYFYNGKNSGR